MAGFIRGVEELEINSHPLTHFTILSIFILFYLILWLKQMFPLLIWKPRVGTEEVKETTVAVVNLLSRAELQTIMSDFVNTH